jgi:hypothetical protein
MLYCFYTQFSVYFPINTSFGIFETIIVLAPDISLLEVTELSCVTSADQDQLALSWLLSGHGLHCLLFNQYSTYSKKFPKKMMNGLVHSERWTSPFKIHLYL